MTIQLDSKSRQVRRTVVATGRDIDSFGGAEGDRGSIGSGSLADRRLGQRVSQLPTPERLRPRVPARRRPPVGLVSPRPAGRVQNVRCDGPRREEEGYRLGRWARLAITLSVLVTALLFVTGALPASHGVEGGVTVEVSVEQGDTLWSIAKSVAPEIDTGAVVAQIRELNGLGDAAVIPVGLILEVPAG